MGGRHVEQLRFLATDRSAPRVRERWHEDRRSLQHLLSRPSDDNARILSTSFGTYEDHYGSFGETISAFRDVTTAMTAIGWTIVVAAGDQGAFADCQHQSVQYPASDPDAIAVGGTTLTLNTAGPGIVFGGESAWSGNGCSGPGGNGGGGCTNTFFAPWWSSPFAQCPEGRRPIPDISLNAGTLQAVFYGGFTSRGGTSIGAPELAGFFAHEASYLIFIEQTGGNCWANGRNGPCLPIGHPGPAFYLGGTRPFYDVRDGSCNGGGPGPGYCTAPGYDLATGLGSANMLQLAWSINRSLSGPADFRPNVTFQGPPTNAWYGTDQSVTFTIRGGTMGVAGYTARWDNDPGDRIHSDAGCRRPILGWTGCSVRHQRLT
jgi:subtilase family serine protease